MKNSFSELVQNSFGGDWGKETTQGNYISKVKCIRGTDIPALIQGNIVNAPIRYILKKNAEVKCVNQNNLIIEISGGSPVQSTGRIAFVDKAILSHSNTPIICSNFCKVLKVKEQYEYFFYQYWNYLYNIGRMFDYENSSTGLKNFDFNAFVIDEKIFIPNICEIERYNSVVKPIYSEIHKNGFEIEKLLEFQKQFLPYVMTRKI